MSLAGFLVGVGLQPRLLAAPQGRAARPGEPPQSYAECRAQASEHDVSELACTYTVLESASTAFVNCLAKQERHRDLIGLPCVFLENRPGLVLQCRKPGNVQYFPMLLPGPCELVYYNPDYVFPTNFTECARRGGELFELGRRKRSCSIVIRLAPFSSNPNKAVVDPELGKRLIARCSELGGRDEMVGTKFPECSVSFTTSGSR